MVEIVMVNPEMVVDLIANAVKVVLQALKQEKAIKIEMTEIMEITKESNLETKMVLVEISKEKVNLIETVDKIVGKVLKVEEIKIADKVEILKIDKVLPEIEVVLLHLLLQWKKTKRLLLRKLL